MRATGAIIVWDEKDWRSPVGGAEQLDAGTTVQNLAVWNWLPDRTFPEHGFPLLSGVGRLVVNDGMMAGAARVTMTDSAMAYLRQAARTPAVRRQVKAI